LLSSGKQTTIADVDKGEGNFFAVGGNINY
jgi:hypothetical protein